MDSGYIMDKKQGLFGIKDGIYLIIAPLVIILPISYWYFNMPPEGYCQTENRRLADQERIEKVVTEILKNYPQVTHRKTEPMSEGEFVDGEWWLSSGEANGSGQRMKKPSYSVPYKDLKEFFLFNPNCCHLTQKYKPKQGEYWKGVNDWDRFIGKTATIVVVKWNLRYVDSKGVLEAKEYEWGLAEDNCGNFVEEY